MQSKILKSGTKLRLGLTGKIIFQRLFLDVSRIRWSKIMPYPHTAYAEVCVSVSRVSVVLGTLGIRRSPKLRSPKSHLKIWIIFFCFICFINLTLKWPFVKYLTIEWLLHLNHIYIFWKQYGDFNHFLSFVENLDKRFKFWSKISRFD